MSDTITLLCLVHGESSQHVFPIDITKNKLVVHLKQQIHKELHPRFERVPYTKLRLWRVSIPADDDALLQSLVLNDEDNSTQKLPPAEEIGEIFSESLKKKHIHIIIEPPKPAGKHKRSSVTLLMNDNHFANCTVVLSSLKLLPLVSETRVSFSNYTYFQLISLLFRRSSRSRDCPHISEFSGTLRAAYSAFPHSSTCSTTSSGWGTPTVPSSLQSGLLQGCVTIHP